MPINLLTGKQMMNIEKEFFSSLDFPPILLMENAALRIADECADYLKTLEKEYEKINAVVLCGTGNNGGDGFAVARLLSLNGINVSVFVFGEETNFTESAKSNYIFVKKLGLNIEFISDMFLVDDIQDKVLQSDLVIDAIFGIGFKGNLPDKTAEFVNIVNNFANYTISIDIPSGVVADSGEVSENGVIKANKTVTLGFPKIGLYAYPGAIYSGEVVVKDIGLPVKLPKDLYASVCTPTDIVSVLPKRLERSHKFMYGKAMIIAGSDKMTGALYLASKAAYVSGCGLVQCCSTRKAIESTQKLLPEAISTYISESDNETGVNSLENIISDVEKASCIAIGPGLSLVNGVKEFFWNLLEYLVESNFSAPIIVDADAITIASENIDRFISLLSKAKFSAVITPHFGEMSRLINVSANEISLKPFYYANILAKRLGCTVVLKDAHTIIASPDGKSNINLTGSNAMSKGGSGDVLTGIIAGLLSQCYVRNETLDLHEVVSTSVFLHGLSGQMSEKEKGEYSVLAGDLIDNLDKAINDIKKSKTE